MTKMILGRRALLAAATATLGLGSPAWSDGHQVLDSIHFLIPGGAGGGGGKAIGFLVENAGQPAWHADGQLDPHRDPLADRRVPA